MREKLVADINEQIRLINVLVSQLKHHEKQIEIMDYNSDRDADNVDTMTALETQLKKELETLKSNRERFGKEFISTSPLYIIKRAQLKKSIEKTDARISEIQSDIFKLDSSIATETSKIDQYLTKTRPILVVNYRHHLAELARAVQKHNILIDEFNAEYGGHLEHISLKDHFEKHGDLASIKDFEEIEYFEDEQ